MKFFAPPARLMTALGVLSVAAGAAETIRRADLAEMAGCIYHKVDALASPSGRSVFVRVEQRCNDETVPVMMFALLPDEVEFDRKFVFQMSSDYDGLKSSLGVFAKWIDEQNLLVAAPAGASLKTVKTDFAGVHIQQAVYPLDSEKAGNEGRKRLIEKRLIFEPTFSIGHGVGVPGIGCSLEVGARDGEYLDRLSLYLTARTTYAANAYDVYKGTIREQAYSSYDFQIAARDEIERPDRHATGAEIVGFSPRDKKSILSNYVLNEPDLKTPSGASFPKWDFVYTPSDARDLLAIADDIKSGRLMIRVGYWLDDEVVSYAMAARPEPKSIDEFQRCISENHILDTPPFGENH